MINKMKRGSYIVNTARGKICDTNAIVEALNSGQLAGYAGDVWFPQPAPKNHPWRSMPWEGMTPHISGMLILPLYFAFLFRLTSFSLLRYFIICTN